MPFTEEIPCTSPDKSKSYMLSFNTDEIDFIISHNSGSCVVVFRSGTSIYPCISIHQLHKVIADAVIDEYKSRQI